VAPSIESFGSRDSLHRATNRKKPECRRPGGRAMRVAPSQHGDISHSMFGQQNCEADPPIISATKGRR
jgi:hypothetical protein